MDAKFLEGIIGLVEATSYETMCLCKEHENEWQQGGSGYGITVGKIKKHPVCISLLVNTVGGHRILFWEATSRIVDHKLIEAWFIKHLPVTAFRDNDPRKYLNKHNAMNFSNIFPRV